MIKYKKRKKYKYILHSTEVFQTRITGYQGHTAFISLDLDGKLTIKPGYAWDGPSGPTIDTKSFMRGSLIHDALYQLIREGILKLFHKNRTDEILREVCLEDGMMKIRAYWVYKGVMKFGKSSAMPDMLTAP